MMWLACLIVLTSSLVMGQRPFFAGSRPIGYPDTPNRTTTESLDNRFGEGTTERLPIEANGDRDLVDRLSKLPIDKQPFWLINWQALEANRNKPQTYPQKPNVFLESIPSNTGNLNSTRATNVPLRPTPNTTDNFGNPIVNAANTFNSQSVQASNQNSSFQDVSSSVFPNFTSFSSFQENSGQDGALNNRFGSFDSGIANTTSFSNATGSGISKEYLNRPEQTTNKQIITEYYSTPRIYYRNPGYYGR